MDLHRTLLKDVILPKLKSVYVVDYYEGLRSLLESRQEFPYNQIFANPRLRTRTEIVWSSDVFDSEPKLLSGLKGADKEQYSHTLYIQIQAVRELIDALKEEEGGEPLSELLSKAISNIEDKSVYCGDGQIVIVNWGLIPRHADIEGASIFRSGKFVGNWEQLHKDDPNKVKSEIDDGDDTSIIHSDTQIPEQSTNIDPASSHSDTVEHQDVDDKREALDEAVDNYDTASNATSAADTQQQSFQQSIDSQQSAPYKSGGFDTASESNASSTTSDSKGRDNAVSDANAVNNSKRESSKSDANTKNVNNDNPEQYNWKHFWYNLGYGLRFLLKKIGWLLLFLLLLLLLLFFTKDCQGPIHKVNPFYNPLPSTPIQPTPDCSQVREQISRLQAQIDSLSNLCPGATEPSDTLRYADVLKDPRELDGTWRATTNLISTTDQTPIDLYMIFKDMSGTLKIVNNDNEYTAPLQAKIENNQIIITQTSAATSSTAADSFVPYQYKCTPDRKGYLFCNAKSSSNEVNFNLVGIK